METKALRKSRGKTINLNLNKRQFVDAFRFMDERDREYIYDELKKILFISKVNNLQKSFADCELTMEDITAEVEAVRKERYETGRQIIA
jgi:hypothetical protein